MKKIKSLIFNQNKKQRIILTSLVFLLVFSLSMIAKSYASTFSNSWLWGGSDDGTGNTAGVGWIDMSKVDVPVGNGAVTGYAWSSNIGWIDFGPAYHCTSGWPISGQYQSSSCNSPNGGTVGVTRSGNSLTGWARIVGIAQASAINNSGGWSGWVKMNNVTINPTTGLMAGFGWNGENIGNNGVVQGLGWINFSKVKAPAFPACGAAATSTIPTCAPPTNNLCSSGVASTVIAAGNNWNWTCNSGVGTPINCNSLRWSPSPGVCGEANGGGFYSKPTNSPGLCSTGIATSITGAGSRQDPWKWDCQGTCGGTTTTGCSAIQRTVWREVRPNI